MNLTQFNTSIDDDDDHVPYEAAVVNGKLEVTLSNLRHFQEYSVEVSCSSPTSNTSGVQCESEFSAWHRLLPVIPQSDRAYH